MISFITHLIALKYKHGELPTDNVEEVIDHQEFLEIINDFEDAKMPVTFEGIVHLKNDKYAIVCSRIVKNVPTMSVAIVTSDYIGKEAIKNFIVNNFKTDSNEKES